MSATPSPEDICVVREAVLEPFRMARNHFHGGEVTRSPDQARIRRLDGRPIDTPERRTPPENLARIDAKLLYGGLLYNHYGHTLTESIHRLWAYDPAIHQGVVFCCIYFDGKAEALTRVQVPRYLHDILGLFDLTPEKVHVVRTGTEIAELHVPYAGSYLQEGPSPWYEPMLSDIANRIPDCGNETAHPSRIYLGRRHIIQNGTILGESYFAEQLEKAGYTYIKPETLDVFSQAALFRQAEEIVFVEGSAIYTTELLPRLKAKVSMLPRRPDDGMFRPHLAGKCDYETVGDTMDVVRLNNAANANVPSSPTALLRPQATYEHLARRVRGLPAFDAEAFERSEAADAAAYARGDEAYLSRLQSDIRTARDARR